MATIPSDSRSSALKAAANWLLNREFNHRRLTLFTAFLFTYTVALILGAPLLYFMCATFLSLVLIAWFISRMSLRHVLVDRFVLPTAKEGDEIELKLRVNHRGRFPRLFVTVRDTLPPWITTRHGDDMHVIPVLLPNQTVTLTQRVSLEKRGLYNLGPMVLVGNDPLGLFALPTRLQTVRELVVYPRTVPVRGLGFAKTGGTGVNAHQLVTVKADGPDFHSVREYLPGDGLRRIHWKSTAHRGEFTVIEFEDSLASDVTLFLDLCFEAQAGSGRISTLEYGIKIAASITEFLLEHGVAVQIIADDELFLPPSVGWDSRHLHRLMEALARVHAKSRNRIDQLVDNYHSRVSHGAAAVVITQEVSEATLRACRRIAQLGSATTCFLMEASAFRHKAATDSTDTLPQPARSRRPQVEPVDPTNGNAVASLSMQLMLAGIKTRVIGPDSNLADNLEMP